MEQEIVSYLNQKGWEFKSQAGEYVLKVCPFCQDSKNHFYISASTGAFHCFKCEEKGNLFSLKKRLGDLPERGYIPKPTKAIDLEKVEFRHRALLQNEDALSYLQAKRGFSLETIKQFRLGCDGDWITIPYLLGGELTKYRRFRGEGEKFKRKPGFDSDLFITSNPGGNEAVIVTEGEFDAISLTQLGFSNVVSVSTGANSFKAEWIDFFEPFRKVFIAFDNDPTGERGAEKLAERLGRYRCYRVTLPQKDANQCLIAGYSKEEITQCFREAEEYRPKNLKGPEDYIQHLERLWKRDRTETVTTGWEKLDRLFGGLRKGELTILTGETGQGKSTWACNLAYNRMACSDLVWIGSFESKPSPLLAKLASMHSQKSFYALTQEEFHEALKFLINLPLRFLDHWGGINLQNLKESIYYCKRRFDTRLVILDHLHAFIQYSGEAERQAIDQAITEIKAWAMDLEIAIFLIVHPKNIQGQRGNPLIEATDLKGSSGIRQWADNIFSIRRNKRKEEDGVFEVALKISKARDDTAREGICVFRFDPKSQRYFDDV